MATVEAPQLSRDAAYPYILKEEGKPARLRETPRVRIAQLAMDYYSHGWSPEEMCRHHRYLTLPEAYMAMAYYFDHKDEIDAEIEAEVKQVDELFAKAPPSPIVARLKAKGLL